MAGASTLNPGPPLARGAGAGARARRTRTSEGRRPPAHMRRAGRAAADGGRSDPSRRLSVRGEARVTSSTRPPQDDPRPRPALSSPEEGAPNPLLAPNGPPPLRSPPRRGGGRGLRGAALQY